MYEPKKSLWSLLEVPLQLMVGAAVYALGIDIFYHPAKLLGGGVTGIAQLLNFLLGTDISLVIVLINIPLMLLGVMLVDREFAVNSLIGMLSLSFFLKLFSGLSLSFESTLTAVVVGGIIKGLGLGIAYRSGAGFGGTDILLKILQRYVSGNMASMGLIFDIVIVGCFAFFYGIDLAVLTVCANYISSQVNSYLIDGRDHRRAVTIVTKKPDEISAAVIRELQRTATVLPAYGAYSRADCSVLYCVISKRQLAKLKRIIQAADPEAFFTITRVTGVYGRGRDFFSIRRDIH